MMPLSSSSLKDQPASIAEQLTAKHLNMLTFLYNAQFRIASEQFDQKIAPYSQIKRQKQTERVEKDQISRLFNAISEKLHQRIVRTDAQTARALSKLQTLWQTCKIQIFHRYYFQKYVFSTYVHHAPTLIKNQQLLIRNEQHIYFTILRAIWARDICLGQIKNKLKEMAPEDMYQHFYIVKERLVQKHRKEEQKQYRVHGYRAKYTLDYRELNLAQTKVQALFTNISNYRKLTTHVIDLIVQWRTYIQSLTHDVKKRKEKIEYYYMQNNYLLSILNDSNFISASFLSNFFTFAVRNDPFILKPILAIEEKEKASGNQQPLFEQFQLKKQITCPQSDLTKMMNAVEQLYHELESNLRNNKFLYKKTLTQNKSLTLSQQSPPLRSSISKNFSIKLTKTNLQSYKSQKHQLPKLQTKNSLMLTKHHSLVKKHSLMKKVSFNDNSPTFKINPQMVSPFNYLNSDQLKFLKQQVVKQLHSDLNTQTKKTLLNSQQFGSLVEQKVRHEMIDMMAKQQQQLLQAQLRVTALSFSEEQIGSFLTSIYKALPVSFWQLQPTQQEISKLIDEIEYCQILRVHTRQQQVAHVIASINKLVKQFKSMEVHLVAFRDIEQLQKIMLKVVEFMCKYENVKEIVFKFSPYSSLNQIFIRNLQTKLNDNCKITEKKYRDRVQAKFIFKHQTKHNTVYNPYPYRLHFKLFGLLSAQKLLLESDSSPDVRKHVHYDYLLMEMLRRYVNSEQFITLRDAFPSKDRFRLILSQITSFQDQGDQHIKLRSVSAENLQELNKKSHQMNKPLLEIADITKLNNLHMIQLEYTFTISHQLRVVSDWNGQKWHRYTILNHIQHITDEDGTEFYKLPVQENHHMQILLFKPKTYLQKHHCDLNLYLSEKMQKYHSCWTTKALQHLWIEMLRYPTDLTQKYERYLSTYRCHELDSIHKDLVLGDTLDWFTDIQIQNGLQYTHREGDLQLTRPLGVGVISNKDCIIYSRIIF